MSSLKYNPFYKNDESSKLNLVKPKYIAKRNLVMKKISELQDGNISIDMINALLDENDMIDTSKAVNSEKNLEKQKSLIMDFYDF
jgi:hypothetical protein